MSLPMLLESAIFIRSHPLVVLGQLLDWLTNVLGRMRDHRLVAGTVIPLAAGK